MSLDAIARRWEATPFFAEYGLRVEEIAAGHARLAVEREHVALRGVRDSLNGGVVASLADAAMQLCVETALEDGERAGPTTELSVSYLSAARGETTRLEARLLRRGRRVAVGDVEVTDAASGELNAKVRVTCAIEPPV